MPHPVPYPLQRTARVVALATLLLGSSVAIASARDSWLVPNIALEGAPELAERLDRDGAHPKPNAATDSADVAAVVTRFHAALAAGDSATALGLLTDDVVILESGGRETRDEYRSHHLPGDIGFAQAIKSQRGPMRVVVRGDVAWVSATSVTQGDYRGRSINSTGAELVVLSRESSGWKIRAIHWSSRARRQS